MVSRAKSSICWWQTDDRTIWATWCGRGVRGCAQDGRGLSVWGRILPAPAQAPAPSLTNHLYSSLQGLGYPTQLVFIGQWQNASIHNGNKYVYLWKLVIRITGSWQNWNNYMWVGHKFQFIDRHSSECPTLSPRSAGHFIERLANWSLKTNAIIAIFHLYWRWIYHILLGKISFLENCSWGDTNQ